MKIKNALKEAKAKLGIVRQNGKVVATITKAKRKKK
jgi:3-methyladenine DNA glycosylase Tag